MAITNNNPSTLNLLQNNGLAIRIFRLPNINFFVQKANLPGLSLPSVAQSTPLSAIIHPGDMINWDNLVIDFAVQEDLSDWLELYEWIKGNGFPEDHQEYADRYYRSEIESQKIISDITLFILDAMKNPKISVTYKDAHPYALSGIDLQTNVPAPQYVTARCAFKYSRYTIERV